MSAEAGRRPRGSTKLPEIPDYRIEEEIGRGATGVVYRARQLAVGREVALKVLHADLAGKERVIRRLQREARTTARLSHPHIVTAINMGETDGLWWYAMELVDGSSLALHLRQEGRLTERATLRLFIPLCEALQHAWEQGVVHRDIKPSNILLDRAGSARLADFGLAFRDDDPLLTSTGDTLGTPHYISPEQARDSAMVDIRSDIWSFGATLFTAVCGRPPFAGESVAEVLSGVLYAHIPDPRSLEPTLSQGFALVIRKCLSREAEHRYQTPRELLLDLERVRERRQPKIQRRELDPVAGPALGAGRLYATAAGIVLAVALGLWAVVARPWASGAEVQVERVGTWVYPPLEELRARVLADETQLGPALSAIESMRESVPTEHLAAWRETRSALRARIRVVLGTQRERAEEELSAALARGDHEAAARLLGETLRAELAASTGCRLEDLPSDLTDFGTWVALRQKELAATRGVFASQVGQLASFFEVTLLPRVERLKSEGRWREAFAALDLDDEVLLAAARLQDVDPTTRTELLAAPRAAIDGRAELLRTEWREVDERLADAIDRRADALEDELRAGLRRFGSVEQLSEHFAAELERRGIGSGALPEEPSARCTEELARRLDDLRDLEDGILQVELERRYRNIEAQAAALLAARQYATVAALWEEFGEEARREIAAGAPTRTEPASPESLDDPGRDWRDSLLKLVELRHTEAGWLLALLERAAERVSALNGQRVRLYASAQRVTGELVAGPDPLGAGFRLVSSEGAGFSVLLQLQRIRTEELERELLGWPARGDEMERSEDRLLCALFRFHEGDWKGARDMLSSGPLPGDHPQLAADLEGRLQVAMELAQRRALEHERDAQRLLSRRELAREEGDKEALRLLIESLLRDYADTAAVEAETTALRSDQKELRVKVAPPSEVDFETAYGTEEVELLAGGRVRLGFSFLAGEAGSWDPGSWTGWSGASISPSWEDFADRPGPSLQLVEPLDPAGGEVQLELLIEQSTSSGPPALLLISVAGYHFGVVGSGLPGAPEVGHVLDGGKLEDVIAGIRSGDFVRGGENLFERGGTYRLRLSADHRRRTASLEYRIELEGRAPSAWRLVQTRRAMPDPASESDSRSIVLRSWESLTLIEATVRGTRRR